jgi:hypothetical protein
MPKNTRMIPGNMNSERTRAKPTRNQINSGLKLMATPPTQIMKMNNQSREINPQEGVLFNPNFAETR